MRIKQQWKLNNNNKRTHDIFIRESNNSENKVKTNNNVKRTHDVFITESNNSENYIIITKQHTMFL